jgi:hypothetical protein
MTTSGVGEGGAVGVVAGGGLSGLAPSVGVGSFRQAVKQQTASAQTMAILRKLIGTSWEIDRT